MRFRTTRGVPSKSHGFLRWRRAFFAVMVMLLMLGVITARLFVWPAQGMPNRVSAIVMLAGPVIAWIRRLSSRGSTGRQCS